MSIEWMLIRGSGIAAYALLSGSVIWGLLVSSKLLGRLVRAKPLTFFHESLGIGALVATAVHILTLSVHEFLPFEWLEILVPGRSDWRPLAVAFGIVALYGLVVVVGSFYIRRLIGQKAWRAIHFASFGVFVSALLHGMMAGTDTENLWLVGLYLGSALAVFILMALRMTGQAEKPARAAPSGTGEMADLVNRALEAN